METRLNIAEILKDKPQNTRLYSLTYGNCSFQEYTGDFGIECQSQNGVQLNFNEYGKYCTEGECMLFPSKEMRDWSKFAWKKGDVLMAGVDNFCIFDKWNNDEYTEFDAAFVTPDYRSDVLKTKYWHEVIGERVIKRYISKIERNYGGKLNLTTLEIEKAHPEFKDGDIVFVESHMLGINTSSMIAIFRKEEEIDKYKFSPALCESNEHDTYLREDSVVLSPSEIKIFRPATDSEKQQLFVALVEECKAWDAENKQIVDLKLKVEFKPFDRVLVRDCLDEMWRPSFFACYLPFGREPYQVIGGEWVKLCIPYEGNESLLGTTKDVKG